MPKKDAPVTPRIRILHDVASTLEVVPYFLKGDIELIQEARSQGRIADLLGDDQFVAVGCGHLKLRHYLDYERLYGEPIDNAVNRILWAFWALNKRLDPSIDDLPMPEFTLENNTMTTPFGVMNGSLTLNVADLLAYALSRLGKIVGKNPDGTFEFEPIEPADVIDLLDPQSLMKVEEDEQVPMLFEMLEITGLYDPKSHKGISAAEKEDGPKNSKTSKTSQRKGG